MMLLVVLLSCVRVKVARKRKEISRVLYMLAFVSSPAPFVTNCHGTILRPE